jgi:TonB family protein
MSHVSDVLRDRMEEPGGFERMATVSVVAHGVLIAIVLLAPGSWSSRTADVAPVMFISLGGSAAGPTSGGQTALGGRAVQEVRPVEEKPLREAPHAPAAKTPEMTIPDPKARTTKTAPPAPVKNAPDDARGRVPIKGDEARPGTALADTGLRGQGFGLSTGGGTSGSGSYLDVANFCCPEYIDRMIAQIRENWQSQSQQNFAGMALVKFTILRDGRITGVILERSSGGAGPDITAQRAVLQTGQLPPLPAPFTNPTLTVHLSFEYQR